MNSITVNSDKLNNLVSSKLFKHLIFMPNRHSNGIYISCNNILSDIFLLYMEDRSDIVLEEKKNKTGQSVNVCRFIYYMIVYMSLVATGKGVRLRNFNSPFYP